VQVGYVVADRFEILSIAGSGGMGVVYRARDKENGRDVALKTLRRPGQEPSDRFAQEVELLSGIDHPRVVGYVTHGTTEDGVPYLVMPWLEGIDLQTRLAAGRLSVDETIALARHVADALAYLHGRGLVHRDLKPGNLFLPGGRVEDVLVMDLGVARVSAPARPLTISGVLVGTPSFIAPEQARGDHEIAPTVDVFALGCVLFECVTGRRLFQGQHVMAVLAKILVEEAPRVHEIRSEIPDALDRIIHRMVAKDPRKRPRDGAQLAAWLADLEHVPALEAPSTPALTASERRVVSVLVVVLPLDAGPASPSGDATWGAAEPLLSASLQFGVRMHALGDRTAIMLAPEDVSTPDQAAMLARFAMRILEQFPGASVALSTGRALVGTSLPVGDAIDRAVAMVRSVASGDGVQVDSVTAALITSRFDVRGEEGRMIVVDERRSLDPTRALLGKPTSCVGREAELAVLETMSAECEAGGGPKVALITASAGAGKSRLRHEFVRRLLARRVPPLVLQARGDALRLSTPYGMVTEIVRQAIGVREREPIENVRQKLGEHVSAQLGAAEALRVTDFLGELVSASFDDRNDLALRAARNDANAMADQIGVAFADIARAWSGTRPVVLVLEDLHWGDIASIKLLDGALRRLEGTPLFLLALTRPEVHERVPGLFGNRDLTEIRLPPLSRRASAKLVEEVLGPDVRSADAKRIVERAEGNAFCLEELIRAVAERARGNSTPPPSHGRDDLPESVIAVAQARLDRLEPEVRKVLRAASIFGDVFWLEGVAALVGNDAAGLESVVAALVEHEVVAPSDPPRLAGVSEFAFRHTLIREAAYATLTEEDRSLGHGLAAKWLQNIGEDGEVVALHALEGGDRARAAESFASAGETRWSRAQADAAARCALRALLVAVGEEANVAACTRLLAQALKATRHVDGGEVITGIERHVVPVTTTQSDGRQLLRIAVDRALAPLRAEGRPGVLAVVLADAARAMAALSDYVDAKKFVEEARVVAGGDELLRRQVRYASARIAYLEGDLGLTWDTLSQGILPEDPRERLELLLMLSMAVVSVHGREALERGLDFVSRAEALLPLPTHRGLQPNSPREDPVARVHCAKARAACFYFTGEYAAGAEATEETARLARHAGLRFDECSHLHNLAEMRVRLGEREAARAHLEQSESIARDIGASQVVYHNAILLAYIEGRGDDLARLGNEAREMNEPWRELHARYWHGRALHEQGVADARSALERALVLARALNVRSMAEECTQILASERLA
jgi:tRNA A-37 threonylcarbamoyl transferase component Bud32